eukprot:6194356-Pleurochrysis_carterae.AAC.4
MRSCYISVTRLERSLCGVRSAHDGWDSNLENLYCMPTRPALLSLAPRSRSTHGVPALLGPSYSAALISRSRCYELACGIVQNKDTCDLTHGLRTTALYGV